MTTEFWIELTRNDTIVLNHIVIVLLFCGLEQVQTIDMFQLTKKGYKCIKLHRSIVSNDLEKNIDILNKSRPI